MAFGLALTGGPIWDDRPTVLDNATLDSLDGLRRIWTEPGATFQFYPVTYTSLWIEHQLWGDWLPGYRLVNLLLHAAAGILLWRLLRALATPGAWWAALLWVIHPVQVESVAWVAERKNVLSGVLGIGALLLLMRAANRERPWRCAEAWTGLALFAAALLAKSSVVALPPVLAILVLLRSVPWRRVLALAGPPSGLALAMAAVTWQQERALGGGGGVLAELSSIDRVAIAGRAAWFYLSKALVPWPLSTIYPRWDPSWIGGLGVFAAAIVIGGCWRWRKALGPVPVAAAGCFVLLLAPTLGFVDYGFMRNSWVADRFLYLALAAVLAPLVGWLVRRSASRRARRLLVAAASLAVSLSLGLSSTRARLFADESALWNDTLQRNPAAWMAHVQLGLAAARRGAGPEAVAALERAHQLAPDSAFVLHRLAFTRAVNGESAAALATYEQAVRLAPDDFELRNDRANLLSDLGYLDQAIAEYQTLLRVAPPRAITLVNLGNALLRADRDREALAVFDRALALEPDHAGAHNGRGGALLRSDPRAARIAFQRATQLQPNAADYWFNLGLACTALGDWPAAITAHRQAVRLQPRFAAARIALLELLTRTGDLAAARAERESGRAVGIEYPPTSMPH